MRLLRGEVAQFGATGLVSETINFGASSMIYTLRASSTATSISASFADNEIKIIVPDALARDWIESNKVGIEADQMIETNENLKILVEKDFICLDRPADADNRDAYPHPSIKC